MMATCAPSIKRPVLASLITPSIVPTPTACCAESGAPTTVASRSPTTDRLVLRLRTPFASTNADGARDRLLQRTLLMRPPTGMRLLPTTNTERASEGHEGRPSHALPITTVFDR